MWPVIIIGLAMLAAVIAAFTGSTSFFNLDLDTTMRFVAATLMLAAVGAGALHTYRGQMSEGLKAIAAWLAIVLVLVAGYAFRFDLASFGNRVVGAVVPGLTLFGDGGEVTVSRSADGHFAMTMKVNGQDVRAMFDTGASSIVLRFEEAAKLGLKVSDIDFSVNVRTANGVTQSAPVMLEEVKLGGISEKRVRALVARPGALGENLLGMTFLERLSSYEVRGEQLILRGRGL
jgi:aspartyl protease family protein